MTKWLPAIFITAPVIMLTTAFLMSLVCGG